MKLKNILNKRSLAALFCTVTLFLVLENPAISQINIYYSYTTISQTQPQTQDGVFYQGSSIITQNTITYVNETTYQPLAYKSTLSIFNFGSFMLLFTPLMINTYFSKSEQKAKTETTFPFSKEKKNKRKS